MHFFLSLHSQPILEALALDECMSAPSVLIMRLFNCERMTFFFVIALINNICGFSS